MRRRRLTTWPPAGYLPALHNARSDSDAIPFRIGEQATLTDPETGEPVTVPVTAAEDGKVTVMVEAVPGSPVKVTAPRDADVVYQYKVPDSHAIH